MQSVNENSYHFNLHGIVGLKLVNPSAADLKEFNNSFSEFAVHDEIASDIVIKFVGKIETTNLKYIGLNDAAFDNDGYYILSTGRNKFKAKVPFDQIDNQLEILCENGSSEIPYLHYFINLFFLKKNYIPLHASAFRFNNQTALVMGWSKGGKTESLLSFAKKGAEYVGDETVIISNDGETVFGIPVPVCVWEWQFKQIPELMPNLPLQKKVIFSLIHLVDWFYKFLKKTFLKKSFITKIFSEALPAFKRQLNIKLDPRKIFKSNIVKGKIPLDKIILIMSHNSSEITINKCEIDEVINRMISSQEYEFNSFMGYYAKFKFAFPDRKSHLLESLNQIQFKLLNEVFKGKSAFKVTHPYPVSFDKLFDVMKSIFEKDNSSLETKSDLLQRESNIKS